LPHQLLDCAGDVLERDLRVHSVLVEKIDAASSVARLWCWGWW
jgi:hypothetical protein